MLEKSEYYLDNYKDQVQLQYQLLTLGDHMTKSSDIQKKQIPLYKYIIANKTKFPMTGFESTDRKPRLRHDYGIQALQTILDSTRNVFDTKKPIKMDICTNKETNIRNTCWVPEHEIPLYLPEKKIGEFHVHVTNNNVINNKSSTDNNPIDASNGELVDAFSTATETKSSNKLCVSEDINPYKMTCYYINEFDVREEMVALKEGKEKEEWDNLIKFKESNFDRDEKASPIIKKIFVEETYNLEPMVHKLYRNDDITSINNRIEQINEQLPPIVSEMKKVKLPLPKPEKDSIFEKILQDLKYIPLGKLMKQHENLSVELALLERRKKELEGQVHMVNYYNKVGIK